MPLHKHETGEIAHEELSVRPHFTQTGTIGPLPRFRMPPIGMAADTAYQLVHDELMLDGNARLNLATFVTTWMERQADTLMAECADKNMIDKDEYPQTAELERRCVNILSDLWHASAAEEATGCSTTGSSEACMLAGLALKWRWRERRRSVGESTDRPNLVMGANVQVCWDKFCRYWDVEARLVPVGHGATHLTAHRARQACDENTIGVVAVLGSTFDGAYEPVADIANALDSLSDGTGVDVPLHVDGASGGWSRRSWTPTWSGTSGSRGSSRSTCRVTSTGSSIPGWDGWCGGTTRPYPRNWSSRSTTSVARCRHSA